MHLSGLSLQNVQPSQGGSPASAGGAATQATTAAPSPAPASPPGGQYGSLLMVLMFVPLMLLMFRGNNKKEKEARAKLKKGDKVYSQSGLVGELVEMEDRFSKVKLGPGNTVTMLTTSLLPLDPATAKADEKDLKDLKEAKATAEKK